MEKDRGEEEREELFGLYQQSTVKRCRKNELGESPEERERKKMEGTRGSAILNQCIEKGRPWPYLLVTRYIDLARSDRGKKPEKGEGE